MRRRVGSPLQSWPGTYRHAYSLLHNEALQVHGRWNNSVAAHLSTGLRHRTAAKLFRRVNFHSLFCDFSKSNSHIFFHFKLRKQSWLWSQGDIFRSKLKSSNPNMATNSPIVTSSGINSKMLISKADSVDESGEETIENDTENEENLDINQRSLRYSSKSSALASKSKYITTPSNNLNVSFLFSI